MYELKLLSAFTCSTLHTAKSFKDITVFWYPSVCYTSLTGLLEILYLCLIVLIVWTTFLIRKKKQNVTTLRYKCLLPTIWLCCTLLKNVNKLLFYDKLQYICNYWAGCLCVYKPINSGNYKKIKFKHNPIFLKVYGLACAWCFHN